MTGGSPAGVSDSRAIEDHQLERFRELVEELASELKHRHGWKTKVAKRLDISLAHLGRVLGGDRQLGADKLAVFAARLEISPAYFDAASGSMADFRRVAGAVPDGQPGSLAGAAHLADQVMRAAAEDNDDTAEVLGEQLAAEILRLRPLALARQFLEAPRGADRITLAVELANQLLAITDRDRALTDRLASRSKK